MFNLQAFINYCQRRAGSLASLEAVPEDGGRRLETEGDLMDYRQGLYEVRGERSSRSERTNYTPPLLLLI